MNNKQATILGLLRLEFRETFRSKKYRTFENSGETYLVGKAGALRFTRGSLAESYSLTNTRIHKGFISVGLHDKLTAEQYKVYFESMVTVSRQWQTLEKT